MPAESTGSPQATIENPQPSSWRKRLFAIGAALAVIATVVGNLERIVDFGKKVYSLVVPSVDISPGVIGSDTNALAAEFVFLNTGTLPLLGNAIDCKIQFADGTNYAADGNVIIAPGRNRSQFISILEPGKPVTRNCGDIIGDMFGLSAPYPATFTITLSSQWPSFWQHFRWTTHATFVGIKDASGHVKIQSDNP